MTTSVAAGLASDLESLRPGALVLPRPAARDDWIVEAACICAAVALHIGAALAFVLQPAVDEASGAGGQYLEAIEISIVANAVLESRDTQPVEQAAAEKGEVVPEVGEQAPEEQPEPKPDEMQAAIEPDEPQPKPPEEQPKPPQAQGGAISAGLEASTPVASGAAAASAGVMNRYAAEVRRALAKNKPDGRGRRGVAIVAFTITPVGKATAVRVTTSSEDEMLDKAALAAVEQTAFPAPPAIMSERDLTYVIPFRFQTK
jgi:periplasmic protein TonB